MSNLAFLRKPLLALWEDLPCGIPLLTHSVHTGQIPGTRGAQGQGRQNRIHSQGQSRQQWGGVGWGTHGAWEGTASLLLGGSPRLGQEGAADRLLTAGCEPPPPASLSALSTDPPTTQTVGSRFTSPLHLPLQCLNTFLPTCPWCPTRRRLRLRPVLPGALPLVSSSPWASFCQATSQHHQPCPSVPSPPSKLADCQASQEHTRAAQTTGYGRVC